MDAEHGLLHQQIGLHIVAGCKRSHPDSKHSAMRKKSRSGGATTKLGRWDKNEHSLFVKGLGIYGRQWKLLAEMIKTRTPVQIRSHAQKYFNKLARAKQQQQKSSSEIPKVQSQGRQPGFGLNPEITETGYALSSPGFANGAASNIRNAPGVRLDSRKVKAEKCAKGSSDTHLQGLGHQPKGHFMSVPQSCYSTGKFKYHSQRVPASSTLLEDKYQHRKSSDPSRGTFSSRSRGPRAGARSRADAEIVNSRTVGEVRTADCEALSSSDENGGHSFHQSHRDGWRAPDALLLLAELACVQ